MALKRNHMKHLTILLTLAALAGATDKLSAVGDIADNRGAGLIQFRISDSLALARFRADSTLAAGFLREAHSLDSSAADQHAKARDRTVQAQTTYDLAVYHLSQDTARKAP
jgi:hypothetical protein